MRIRGLMSKPTNTRTATMPVRVSTRQGAPQLSTAAARVLLRILLKANAIAAEDRARRAG